MSEKIRTEYHVSGMDLPAILCSQGGVPYNKAHIEYWKQRAQVAEKRLDDCFAGRYSLQHDYGMALDSENRLRARLDSALDLAREITRTYGVYEEWQPRELFQMASAILKPREEKICDWCEQPVDGPPGDPVAPKGAA